MKTLLFWILITFANESYAYIDPGTGAFLVQSLIALAVSIAFYIRHPIRFIQLLIGKIFKKKNDERKKEN